LLFAPGKHAANYYNVLLRASALPTYWALY